MKQRVITISHKIALRSGLVLGTVWSYRNVQYCGTVDIFDISNIFVCSVFAIFLVRHLVAKFLRPEIRNYYNHIYTQQT